MDRIIGIDYGRKRVGVAVSIPSICEAVEKSNVFVHKEVVPQFVKSLEFLSEGSCENTSFHGITIDFAVFLVKKVVQGEVK